MRTIKTLIGGMQTTRRCHLDDIDAHIRTVTDVMSRDSDMDEIRSRMVQAITEGTAFTTDCGLCCLYYLKTEIRIAEGVVIYGKGNPVKMLALLACVFTEYDIDTAVIRFHLHKGTLYNDYKSIVTLNSIKRQIMPNTPLVVKVASIRARIERLHSTEDPL